MNMESVEIISEKCGWDRQKNTAVLILPKHLSVLFALPIL